MKNSKLNFILSLVTFNFSLATIINIPNDQHTIQQGIDIATEGDTVLVQPGRYYENINFNGKNNITLASLEMLTGDEEYINSTIIDGNKTGSCIHIGDYDEQGIVIQGFRITNGSGDYLSVGPLGGGLLICSGSEVSIISCRIDHNDAHGGGILINESQLYLSNVSITDNIGYGIVAYWYPEIIFDQVNKCNIYRNHFGDIGVTKAGGNHGVATIDVVLDTFTVINPDDIEYFAMHDEHTILTFDIQNGWMELVDDDLFVSAQGDDSNNGLSPEEPLKSIEFALQKIRPDSLIQRVVHVAHGEYSDEFGELYPLIVRDNILLTGDSMENTTLINNSSQFTIGFRDGSLIENLTITGNNRAFSAWEKDSVFIKNVTIENIGLTYEDAGDLTLISYVDYLECDNLIIRNSEASHGSNGLIAKVNSAKLTNCVFDNNIQNCSGVTSASFRVKDSLLIENCIFSNSYSDYVSSDGFSHAEIFNVGDQQFQHAKTTMINCLFSDNYCRHEANVTLSSSYINIINCTFTGNESQLAPIRYGKGQGQIYNSILYNPTDHEVELAFCNTPDPDDPDRELFVSHSLIKGGIDAICNIDPWTGECNTDNSNWNFELYWLGGNLDIDPMFNNPNSDDYSLRSNSHCINAGTLDLPPGISLPEYDLAGNRRVDGGQIDMGAYEFQGSVDNDYKLEITNYELMQCYPNPFNPVTVISYELEVNSDVDLSIYNLHGQKIEQLVDSREELGYQEQVWDASSYPSGVYFVKLVAGGFTDNQKIMLVK